MVFVKLEDQWRVFQVEIDLENSPDEIYGAVCEVLELEAGDPGYHLVTNSTVLSEENVTTLLKDNATISVRQGPAPASGGGGSATGPGGMPVPLHERLLKLGLDLSKVPERTFGLSETAREHYNIKPPGHPRNKGSLSARASGPGEVHHPHHPVRMAPAVSTSLYKYRDTLHRLGKGHPKPPDKPKGKSGRGGYGGGELVGQDTELIYGGGWEGDADSDGGEEGEEKEEPLDSWLGSYDKEKAAFLSTAAYTEAALQEALHRTQEMEVPNSQRTKVVFQLMHAVLAKFSRFRSVTGLLWQELLQATYVDPSDPESPAYFEKYDRLVSDYNTLQAQKELVCMQLGRSEKRGERRMAYAKRTILNMQVRAVRQTFQMWRSLVHHMRQSRGRLRRVVTRWRMLLVMRAFETWRSGVVELKESRLHGQIEDVEKTNEACLFRAKRAEEGVLVERAAKEEALLELRRQNDKHDMLQRDIERLRAEVAAANKKISESRETEFKTLAPHYMEVFSSIAREEYHRMRADAEAFVAHDPSMLLKKGEGIEVLMQIHPQDVIIRWLNFHLDNYKQEKILNLGTDLRDGKELVIMLHVANPKVTPLKWLKEVDPSRVAAHVMESSFSKHNFPHGILEDDGGSILSSKMDHMFIFCSHFFEFHPSMDSDTMFKADAMAALDRVAAGLQALETFDPLRDISEGEQHPAEAIALGMEAALEEVRKMKAEGARREAPLASIQRRCRSHALDVIGHILQGDPLVFEDGRLEEEIITYTELDPVKVQDLGLPLDDPKSAEELRDMKVMLEGYFSEVKRIYKYYAAGGAMSSQEFWKMIKECKFADKKLSGAQFDMFFHEANREFGEDGYQKISIGTEDDDDNPDFELLPAEYVECLLRIANAKYAKEKGLPTLTGKLEKLLTECLLPNAGKSDAEEFRTKLGEKELREVFDRHRDNLRKIFLKFAGADDSDASAKNNATMNIKEVEIMLKQVNLMGLSFSSEDVDRIFTLVQDNEGNDGDGLDEDSELVFTEFLEFLVVTAIHRDPNPYVPLAKRLDHFFTKDLSDPLAGKLKLKPTRTMTLKERKLSARKGITGLEEEGGGEGGAGGVEAMEGIAEASESRENTPG